MTIGKKVATLRDELGIGQTELGRRIGKSRTAISDIENDKAQPRLETLRDLSRELGVPLAYLTGEGSRHPEKVAEPVVAYDPEPKAPTTVEQLTQVVATLTKLVETGQEQQARLLDQQDKLLARLQQAQDQLDKGLDMRAELDKRDAKIATLEGKILAAGAPDSPAVRRLAQ